MAVIFAFDFDPRYAGLVRVVSGATPRNSSVELDEGELVVRFGWLGARTPVSNIRDVRITRDYRWFRAVGARLSLSDRGATFGTNATGGVCVCFHEPVKAHPVAASPALTVTVADLEGVAEAIREAAGLS